MAYWWVNQSLSRAVQTSDQTLWAPIHDRAGATRRAYDSIMDVRPGDTVLQFSNRMVVGVGTARSTWRPRSKPAGLPQDWDPQGRAVRIAYVPCRPPIHRDELPMKDRLANQSPGPFDVHGHVRQSAYLSPLTPAFGDEFLIRFADRLIGAPPARPTRSARPATRGNAPHVRRSGRPRGDKAPPWSGPAPRAESTGQRLVRRATVGAWVKSLYRSRCQVCRRRLDLPSGPYAESAHIRPLGAPHGGNDDAGNVLCLCPNDHVRFDAGAIALSHDLEIVRPPSNDPTKRLLRRPAHLIDLNAVDYHRRLWLGRTQ